MHGAAFAVAQSGSSAEDLIHHPPHVATLGNAMTVSAVCRGDVIAFKECFADSNGNRFLPCVQMNETRDIARGVFLVQALFEMTNLRHPTVSLEQRGARRRGLSTH